MYIAPSCSHRSSTGDPYRRSHPAANPAAASAAAACLVPWPAVACLAAAYQVIAVAVAVLSSAAHQASLRFR